MVVLIHRVACFPVQALLSLPCCIQNWIDILISERGQDLFWQKVRSPVGYQLVNNKAHTHYIMLRHWISLHLCLERFLKASAKVSLQDRPAAVDFIPSSTNWVGWWICTWLFILQGPLTATFFAENPTKCLLQLKRTAGFWVTAEVTPIWHFNNLNVLHSAPKLPFYFRCNTC